MSEKRYKMMTTIIDPFPIWDTVEEKGYNCTDTLEVLVFDLWVMMMTDSYDYFNRCESCIHVKSYCFDEYDSDVWCEIFDEFKKGYCEKFERLKDE